MLRILVSLLFYATLSLSHEITSHKWDDKEGPDLSYSIPYSSKNRCTLQRNGDDAPPLLWYFSYPPQQKDYPITIFCTGSSNRESAYSIVHVHRYFLQEVLDAQSALITLEQWGMDGHEIDKEEFFKHYTRSQRFDDHCLLINHLINNPPVGWNGKFIFIGVSEGGPLVTRLTALYNEYTLATINWCGADGWSWKDELWRFSLEDHKNAPWYVSLADSMPLSIQYFIPEQFRFMTRNDYEQIIQDIVDNPTADKEFYGMSYAYHADALAWPVNNYDAIKTPFLVVAGAQDSNIIDSVNDFVAKAQAAQCPISYLRIADMDHYIIKRPDIIAQSFAWLQNSIDSKL